ncbi:radical SAM protein [Clostridium swellfunianum]|uniref:radical SAM protein n=1 Tax=Clostridium swellfunianum TaxID=1367462 RepID=UPI00202E1CA7|nr:radical SAM protein [Clostridium swellfunianum]MCM0649112.1 radical SAM protein [Clostridium swellfunianum]
MKKQFQNWAWSQGMKFTTKVHDLTYFFWETTLSCNLKCRHCGSDCDKDKFIEELPKEKVLQVFKNIAENYEPKDIMVAVTGGEPLVRKDLFEILSEVSSMGFPWGMVTNGMLVDEAAVEKCAESGMKTVSVSLDGLREAHNHLRNSELSYDRAVNALRLFLKSGKFDIVEAITCVNSDNINQLEDMYKLLKDIGVQGWRLFTIFPKGRAEVNSELLLNKDLVIRLFNFIKDKRNSNPGMHISYSEEGYLGCNWEREVRDDFFFCGAGINIGSLLADGSYSACPSLPREWIQGHVDEISFSEAWETRYKNMRDRKWMRTKGCESCKQWSNCNGSSLHLWDFKEGKTKVCHYNMLNA